MSNQFPDTNANEMESRLQLLESAVFTIKQRNVRVELDKAWETSRFRIISVTLVTWLVISLVFWAIEVERPLLNALIPAIAFYLSTQTFPLLKTWWINHKFAKQSDK